MSPDEILGKVERNELSATDAMEFLSKRPDLPPGVLYNVASGQALLEPPGKARKTLKLALTQATTKTRGRLSKHAIADPTFSRIWADEEGEAFEDQLRAAAGMPPLTWFQKQRRKMGCLSRP